MTSGNQRPAEMADEVRALAEQHDLADALAADALLTDAGAFIPADCVAWLITDRHAVIGVLSQAVEDGVAAILAPVQGGESHCYVAAPWLLATVRADEVEGRPWVVPGAGDALRRALRRVRRGTPRVLPWRPEDEDQGATGQAFGGPA